MASIEEAKLERFLQWLQVNNVELRGCKIKFCDENKGFGIFSANEVSDGVLLVVPLDLAITPMRVLQDPLIGAECRAMFQEGEVDDRFLILLFLTVERLRKNSTWKPYFDILPITFESPSRFTDDELLELKGTTLYRATELQKQSLRRLYDEKVQGLVNKLLIPDGDLEREVSFEDFLWANSVFWTRALNIPMPQTYVFPQNEEDQSNCSSVIQSSEASADSNCCGELAKGLDGKRSEPERDENQANGVTSSQASLQKETLWVEGLVPGIDFCNHGSRAEATWEVDGTGSVTGVPFSMYLLSAKQSPFRDGEEIFISYGNKGNEELLYLYGFVTDENPDDYLMVHYPVEAIQSIASPDFIAQLLEAQKAEMRCLLPKSLLDQGFFSATSPNEEENNKCKAGQFCNFSWSGQRKIPSYLDKLVFPENFLAALRTVAMREDEQFKVSSLLEELVGGGGERQPSESEVRAAVWEACGDSGALQLLVDLLQVKLMELEESSGTEDRDSELLAECSAAENIGQHAGCENDPRETGLAQHKLMNKKRWSSIVYRRGQKKLARLFLNEAEHALQLALSEGN